MFLDMSRGNRIATHLGLELAAGVEILKDRNVDQMSLHLKNPLIWIYDSKNKGQMQEEDSKLIQRRDYTLHFGTVKIGRQEVLLGVHPSLVQHGALVSTPLKLDPGYVGELMFSVKAGFENIDLDDYPWVLSLSVVAN